MATKKKKGAFGSAAGTEPLESLIESERSRPKRRAAERDEFIKSGRTTKRELAAESEPAAPEPKRRVSVAFHGADYEALVALEHDWYRRYAGGKTKKLPPVAVTRALVRAALPLLESLPPQGNEDELLGALRQALAQALPE